MASLFSRFSKTWSAVSQFIDRNSMLSDATYNSAGFWLLHTVLWLICACKNKIIKLICV